MVDTRHRVRNNKNFRSLMRRTKARAIPFILTCSLVTPTFGFAQQQGQQRILVPEEQKAKTEVKQDGPRGQKPQLVLQTGITGPGLKLAYSPDGRLLATM